MIEVQLPAISREVQNGKLTVDSIDVFCEKGVFNVDQSRRMLQAGVEHGLMINFHAEELNPLKGAEVGSQPRIGGRESNQRRCVEVYSLQVEVAISKFRLIWWE